MTFLEAAVTVLEREGRPLHFREITKLAIDLDLLSHIGSSPEHAMQTRLAAATRRGTVPGVLVKAGPGIYAFKAPVPSRGRTLGKQLESARERSGPRDEDAPARKQIEDGTAARRKAPGARTHDATLRTDAHVSVEADGAASESERRAVDSSPDAAGEPRTKSKRRRRRRRKPDAAASADLLTGVTKLVQSRGGRVSLSEIADSASARGYVGGGAPNTRRVIAQCIETDNVLRVMRGRRPRFDLTGESVGLWERGDQSEAYQVESRILADVERLRQLVRSEIGASLRTLPIVALAAVVKACLEGPPTRSARLVSIIGDGEARILASAAVSGRGHCAVVVLKVEADATAFIAQRVVELRRTLRELKASSGLVVVDCPVAVETAEAAGVPGEPAVDLWDADAVALRMESLGLGCRELEVPVRVFDDEFFRRLRR